MNNRVYFNHFKQILRASYPASPRVRKQPEKQLNSETQRTQTAEMNKHGYSVFFVCVLTPKRKFNISKKVY